MAIEHELHCIGFFGFGSGYVGPGKAGHGDMPMYCNTCSMKEGCWQKHRDRMNKMFPALAEEIERLVKSGMSGPELVKHWFRTYKTADPYMAGMLGNLQDGASVKATGKPTDRQEATLPYPFVVH